MGKPPWDGLEAKVQKFCDARRDSIKFAIRASAINLDDQMLDHLGRKFLEDGIRGLVPIIDTPQSVAAGSEALKKIIKGIAFLSVSAAYSEIAKNAFGRERTQPGRDKKQTKDDARIPDLDAAIIAETTDLILSRSIEFARKIHPGVRERLGLPRDGKGWPSPPTIKRAVSERIKPAKTNRVSLTKAKTNRVSR